MTVRLSVFPTLPLPHSRGSAGLRAGLVSLLLALSGCQTANQLEVVESKLRQQESFISDLESELERVRTEAETARFDAESLRSQLADKGRDRLVAEQAAVLAKVEKITLNPLLTRGVDSDDDQGDERFSVLLMPVDKDGELVKLPGQIDLQLVDLSLPANRQRLGQWSWSTQEVREKWHRGLLAAGFLFDLDWQQPPVNSQITLHATLTTPDGRKFDTQLPLTVTPPAPGVAKRRAAPSASFPAVASESDETVPVSPEITPAGAEAPE